MTSCRRNSTAWLVTRPASSAPSTCAQAYRCLKQFKIVQNEHFEEDKQFHSMQSLIDARIAQQNSERTQPVPEPTTFEPLSADHFEKINREFEEMPAPPRA